MDDLKDCCEPSNKPQTEPCTIHGVVCSALIIKTMSTNFTKHNNKAKKYLKQIDEIQAKYPDVNMKSKELLRDINKLHELFIKVIHEEVDAKECKSDNPDDMCSDCTCWKHTRMMCS